MPQIDLPENPVLTTRKKLRLTQKQFAERLGVSEQSVRRAEQGTFNSLPASFHIYVDPLLYEQFRVIKRNELRPLVPTNYEYSREVKGHPHFLFRQEIMRAALEAGLTKSAVGSIAGYAKLVAIDPDTVKEFEASYQMPRTYMANLLGDLGVSRDRFHYFMRRGL